MVIFLSCLRNNFFLFAFSVLSALFSFLVMPQQSHAEVFKFLGARPAGMGGAFVAVAEGSLAQYWNPAGLGLEDSVVDVRLPVGATVELTNNLLEKTDNLSDLATNIDRIQGKAGTSSMTLDDYKDFVEILNTVNALNDPGLGILGDVHAGLSSRIWKFALSVNTFTEFSGKPTIDLSNINLTDNGSAVDAAPGFGDSTLNDSSLTSTRDNLAGIINDLSSRAGLETGGSSAEEAANAIINEAKTNGTANADITSKVDTLASQHSAIQSALPTTGTGSFDDNDTNLTLRGASIIEISLGFGGLFSFQEDIPVLSDMIFGGNLKGLLGTVGYGKISILDKDADVSDVADEMTNDTKDSTRISLDLGILYDKKEEFGFRSGILFRNITSPSFDAAGNDPEGKKFNADAQVRLGAAYWPVERWTIAADIDIIENKTALSSYNSRLISLGTEYKFLHSKKFDFALRTGLYKNIAESDAALAFTFGFGVTAAYINLDIAGAISPSTVKTADGGSIPASAGASLSLSVVF